MLVRAVLLTVAAVQLLSGALAFAAPSVFYDLVASYPPENDHFLRDVGSWQVALGLAALIAANRPAWRVPMLGVLTVQFALHAISHAIDVDVSDPDWQGPFALVTQGFGAVLLAGLFVRERAAAQAEG